ncbi:hypothetical protein [Acidisphaera sp. L21]|uniref:hypothetical protein n=1 Tax=Acidisphaera sp. L21 TaxID=1641851 RepID=UPI00131B3FE9|nr:hypothetical protein [Acidisphaera sp. L21]
MTPRQSEEADFAGLAGEHATLGGINEQPVGRSTGNGIFTEVQAGLDAIMARIQGARRVDLSRYVRERFADFAVGTARCRLDSLRNTVRADWTLQGFR